MVVAGILLLLTRYPQIWESITLILVKLAP